MLSTLNMSLTVSNIITCLRKTRCVIYDAIPFLRPSVCLSHRHTYRDSPGAACDAASVHFDPTVKRINILVTFCEQTKYFMILLRTGLILTLFVFRLLDLVSLCQPRRQHLSTVQHHGSSTIV